MEEIEKKVLEDIRTKVTVPIWPHLGVVFECSRGQAYAMANRGDVDVFNNGRLKRVVTAPLRKRLGIDAA